MWKTPITLRRLLDPACNINVWERDENGVYVPVETSTGFVLFSTSNPYPLFFDGSYYIGGMQIIPEAGGVPVYDNNYRDALNKKIMDHYANYRIGADSPNLFYHNFNTLLNEIMPEYNAKYRLVWGFFAEKLPYGYFEEKYYNGGTKNAYNSDYTTKHGDISTFDWSGGQSGTSPSDPAKSSVYNFDTPQNMSSLDPTSPDHMSSATVATDHGAGTFTMSGYVDLNNGVPEIKRDSTHPTGKRTEGDTTNENRGYDTQTFENRSDKRYGYTSNDFKLISEFNNELSNIDLEIIKALRDCFLYTY